MCLVIQNEVHSLSSRKSISWCSYGCECVYSITITLRYCLFFASFSSFWFDSHTHYTTERNLQRRKCIVFSHIHTIDRNSTHCLLDEKKKQQKFTPSSQVIEHRRVELYEHFHRSHVNHIFQCVLICNLSFFTFLSLTHTHTFITNSIFNLCGYKWVYLTISALSIASARASTHTASSCEPSWIFPFHFASASKFTDCIESNSIWIDNRKNDTIKLVNVCMMWILRTNAFVFFVLNNKHNYNNRFFEEGKMLL